MDGLAKRLADFIDAWMEPLEPKPSATMPAALDHGQLARQLLTTLSPQTLRDTGYLKPRHTADQPRSKRPPRRGPQPAPVGDLARPRPDVEPGPIGPLN